ncbi:hypothetical protein [Kineococcus aurantiacus]|uniref:Uncharacterized protein n=1 Tax=Kineococcus aurantiacus TaxID=37633 RepID=A0A7Y9J3B9_9ACTN|nr:hypothetical protein [Kineococcus aurantiacus]NYD24950.1 hypothetical protein [Kineococcus aurantiacus]
MDVERRARPRRGRLSAAVAPLPLVRAMVPHHLHRVRALARRGARVLRRRR